MRNRLKLQATISGMPILTVAMVAVLATPAQARREISPYIEVQQVLDADFDGRNDVLTYTSIAAGVDATVSGGRLESQVSYRYERRIGWNDNLKNEDNHSGLARTSYAVSDSLKLDASAMATRTRQDFRSGGAGFNVGDQDNTSQVYSVNAGPTFQSHVGPLDVGASYRIGYVKVEDKGDVTLPGGQRPLDSYDDSISHSVSASVGMQPGALPFGWQVSAGYDREDTSQLDQRYESAYGRGDVTLPVSPTLALTAGVGYEDIQISERGALVDANGNNVVDGNGRYITDPASPRLLSYDSDGLMYDAGIIWRPSARTTLQLRGGKRYGGTSVTGSLAYQISPSMGLSANVYNSIDSFGRGLNRQLGNMPTSFRVSRNAMTNDFGGCVYGSQPGQGGCFNSLLNSAATENYRNRGANVMLNGARGPWTMGVGVGYDQRKYLAPTTLAPLSLGGVKDESWTAQADVSRQIGQNASVSAGVFGELYDPGIAGANNVTSLGGTVSYNRAITNRLSANAAAGYFTNHEEGGDTASNGSVLVGMRYTF